MALPRPRKPKRKVEVPRCLATPHAMSPPLPSRGQRAVEFLLEGSRVLGCPKRAPSTAARPLSRGPRALIGLPFSVWTGACYWHGVGGSMFNSSSQDTATGRPARKIRFAYAESPAKQRRDRDVPDAAHTPGRGPVFS